MRKLCALSVVVVLLAGCAGTQQPGARGGVTKADVGTIVGGAAGAVAGSNLGKGKGRYAAIAVGTLLGAAMGQSIGATFDRVDQMYHEQTAQKALETARSGTTLAWSNPDSGHSGTVTPINVLEKAPGQYCREYRQTVKIGDKTEELIGTACRQPDGTWKAS